MKHFKLTGSPPLYAARSVKRRFMRCVASATESQLVPASTFTRLAARRIAAATVRCAMRSNAWREVLRDAWREGLRDATKSVVKLPTINCRKSCDIIMFRGPENPKHWPQIRHLKTLSVAIVNLSSAMHLVSRSFLSTAPTVTQGLSHRTTGAYDTHFVGFESMHVLYSLLVAIT